MLDKSFKQKKAQTNEVINEFGFTIETVPLSFEVFNKNAIVQAYLSGKLNYQESLSIPKQYVYETRAGFAETSEGIFLYLTLMFAEKGGSYIWLASARLNPCNFLEEPLKNWKQELEHQTNLEASLVFDIPYSGFNSLVFNILSKSEINLFIKNLNIAIVKNTILTINQNLLSFKEYEEAYLGKMFDALRLQMKQTSIDISLSVIEENVIKYIIKEFDPETIIYKKAKYKTQDLLKEFNLLYHDNIKKFDYLNPGPNQFAKNKQELFDYLSSQSPSSDDEAFKTYMFCRLSYELTVANESLNSIASNKFHIVACPYGRNGSQEWHLAQVKLESLESFVASCSTFKYLLLKSWGSLLDDNIIPVQEFHVTNNCINLGEIPTHNSFTQIDKLLEMAVIEQKYPIDRLSTIFINKVGCHEISYMPTTDKSGDILIRVVIYQVHETNYCLFGCLNPFKKQIDWAHSVHVSDVMRQIIKLLEFIVAVGYRDLIVARPSFKQNYYKSNKSKYKNSKIPTSHTKSKLSKGASLASTPIILIPRLERNLEKSFADPDNFVKAVKKMAPHFRSAHIRLLPPGHQPSQQQMELASSLAIMLPTGYTFVRSTHIGGETQEEVQARAAFQSLSLLELLFQNQD